MSDHASHSNDSTSDKSFVADSDKSFVISGGDESGDKAYYNGYCGAPACPTAGFNPCTSGQYNPCNNGQVYCPPSPCYPTYNPCNGYCNPCVPVCVPCVTTSLPSRAVLSANQFDSQQALGEALDAAAVQTGIATNEALNRANFNVLIAGLACGYIEDLGDSYMQALRSQVINESDVTPAVFAAEVIVVNAFALHAEGRAASESVLATMASQFFEAIGQLLTASFAADLLTLRTTYYALMASISGWPSSISTQLLAAGLVESTYDFTPVTACAGACGGCTCIFCVVNSPYYVCENTSCSCIVATT